MSSHSFATSLVAKQIYATSVLPSYAPREMTFTYDNILEKVVAGMPNQACEPLEDIEVERELNKASFRMGREFYTDLLEAVVEPLVEKTQVVYLRIESIKLEGNDRSTDQYQFYPEGWANPLVVINEDIILNKAQIQNTTVSGKDNIKDKIEDILILPPSASRLSRWASARKLWYQRMIMTKIKRASELQNKFLVRDYAFARKTKIKSNKFDPMAGSEELVFRHLNYLTHVKGYDDVLCQFEGNQLHCYEQESKLRLATFYLNDNMQVLDIEYIYYRFEYCKCSTNVFSPYQPFAKTLMYMPKHKELMMGDLTNLPDSYYLKEESV